MGSVGTARRALVWLSVWAACGGTAHAAETSAHVTWSASLRYSDNIQGVPSAGAKRPLELPEPVADLGLQFSPGGALVHTGPRASWVLSYSHPMLLYVRHPLAHNSGDVIGFSGTFLPGPLDVLDAEASVSRFDSTLTSLVEPTDSRAITAIRNASAALVRAQAALRHRHDHSEAWSSFTELRSTIAVPLDDGAGIVASDGAVGARWSHRDHALGLAASALHARRLRESPRSDDRGVDDSVVIGPELRWNWDWTERWSSAASAGWVAPVVGTNGTTARPVASVSVGYDHEASAVTFEARRAYTPSPLTAQVFFADTYSVRGQTPLVASWNLDATTGSGLARSRILEATSGRDTNVVTTLVVDVALGWSPPHRPRWVLGYQWTRQRGADPDQPLLPSFDRHIVSLGVEYAFPPPPTAGPRTPARRVDTRDRVPVR